MRINIKMITKLFPLLLLCMMSMTSIAQDNLDQLSLDDFLKLSREKALGKKVAKMTLKEAELNYALFQSDLKPQLSASANFPNYAKTFSEITQPNGDVLFQPVTNNNSAVGLEFVKNIAKTGGAVFVNSNLQRFDNFESNDFFYNGNPIRVGIYQPLLSFNPLKWGKKIEPLKMTEAKKRFSAEVEAINTQAAAIFADLLVINEELQIAVANEEGNQTLFNHAQEKFRLGKISNRDLMRLKLGLISAQKDRKKAEQLLAATSSNIYSYLGKKHQGEIIAPTLPIPTEVLTIDQEMAIKKAWENRHDLINQNRRSLEAERDLERAKKESGVNLDLQASFGLVRSSKDLADIYGSPQQQQFAQLQLFVPILDGGQRKSRVALAQAQKDFTAQQIQQEKLQFETEIAQLVATLNYLGEELKLTSEIQKVAGERFEITQKSFVLGAINTTELILAQQERDQASRAYILTIRDYWQAYYDLRNRTLFDFENKKNIIY